MLDKFWCRFWWKARSIWHYVSMYKECVKPDTFIMHSDWEGGLILNTEYWRCVQLKQWRYIPPLIWKHTKGLLHRMLWEGLAFIGFGCASYVGLKPRWWRHWRTDFCEWMEFRARYFEEKASLINREDNE